MILLDTSVLIENLTGPRSSARQLRGAIARGERIVLATLVLYEWLRGPRTHQEIEAQEVLFPTAKAIVFGMEEAAEAARLYRGVQRPRGREMDLAIAACALLCDAELWTLNVADFDDIPGLRVRAPG